MILKKIFCDISIISWELSKKTYGLQEHLMGVYAEKTDISKMPRPKAGSWFQCRTHSRGLSSEHLCSASPLLSWLSSSSICCWRLIHVYIMYSSVVPRLFLQIYYTLISLFKCNPIFQLSERPHGVSIIYLVSVNCSVSSNPVKCIDIAQTWPLDYTVTLYKKKIIKNPRSPEES